MKKRLLVLISVLLLAVLIPAFALADLDAATVSGRMLALKKDYPEGMTWTNDNYYEWNGGVYSGGYGCHGFALMLSDAAFGSRAARKITDIKWENVRVGDVLRLAGDSHTVIITGKENDYVVIAEGNYNDSVHWGRTLTRDDVESCVYYLTRYDKQEGDPLAVPSGGGISWSYCPGAAVTDYSVSVSAEGDELIYQWQVSKDGGNTWSNCPGANQEVYEFTATANMNGWQYRCHISNSAGCIESASFEVEVEGAAEPVTLNSVKFNSASVQVKKNVTITATTSTNVTKLSMYNGSSLITSWTGGYTDSGSTRTWKVSYAFSGAGSRTMTFIGTDSNGTDTEAKTAAITVTAAPTLNSVKFNSASVQVKKTVGITAATSTNVITAATSTSVTKLSMYNGSSLIKTWTSGYTDSGSTRTWKVSYAFSGAGSRTMTFKGFDASGTATAAKTATVTVTAAPAAPTLNSVKFSASSVQVKKTVSITATTSTSVTSLTMYSENGTAAKTWTSGYTDSGSTRTWKVSYTFSGAGSRTMTFRGTGADGTVTGAKTAGITVTK